MDDHAPLDVAGPPPGDPDVTAFAARFAAARSEIERVLLGQQDAVESVLVGLFAAGHVLLEGPPGIGKTLLARSIAKVLGVSFKRIQFTPDLMPSDVTGSNLFNRAENRFVFREGPIFTEVLLADEINRAPAKTQAALLEAMSDRQVTVDGETRTLPDIFLTIATQNPIESEGTYPLPEAQLDRFVMKVLVAHPPPAVEVRLLQHYLDGFDASDLEAARLQTVIDAAGIQEMRAVARQVRVDPEILDY
ncbi:MAG: AAA family ATPase, partial [Myxococcota bacterium]